jgi:hypothetical protein
MVFGELREGGRVLVDIRDDKVALTYEEPR